MKPWGIHDCGPWQKTKDGKWIRLTSPGGGWLAEDEEDKVKVDETLAKCGYDFLTEEELKERE